MIKPKANPKQLKTVGKTRKVGAKAMSHCIWLTIGAKHSDQEPVYQSLALALFIDVMPSNVGL